MVSLQPLTIRANRMRLSGGSDAVGKPIFGGGAFLFFFVGVGGLFGDGGVGVGASASGGRADEDAISVAGR